MWPCRCIGDVVKRRRVELGKAVRLREGACIDIRSEAGGRGRDTLRLVEDMEKLRCHKVELDIEVPRVLRKPAVRILEADMILAETETETATDGGGRYGIYFKISVAGSGKTMLVRMKSPEFAPMMDQSSVDRSNA